MGEGLGEGVGALVGEEVELLVGRAAGSLVGECGGSIGRSSRDHDVRISENGLWSI